MGFFCSTVTYINAIEHNSPQGEVFFCVDFRNISRYSSLDEEYSQTVSDVCGIPMEKCKAAV